ncbi:MAG: PmoA family protein [Thermofilaceae archaeon]|nr:PmoA family protein [Thermofilaceae archaeon]MCX8180035.1 PmoA family protein [Thermofilaceae archaeon]MDW8003222.1 PmoA family protein [Thermofilaceae archaeon]
MTKLKVRAHRKAVEDPCETLTGLSDGSYILKDEAGYCYPSQVSSGKLSFIIPCLGAGETREFLLLDETPSCELKLADTGDEIRVARGSRHVASYKYKGVRIPYIYPLNLDGICITEDSPRDHPHHNSLWTAHGDVNGIDFWAGDGKVRTLGFIRLVQGSAYAEIVAENSWEVEGSSLLREIRRIRFWNTPSGEWLIDYEVLLKPEGSVVLGDTKEAGIVSVRVANSMTVLNGGKITNSWGGVNEKEVWGRRAEWCDYSGPVAGSIYGIAVFDHPTNPRFPTYWHTRDYGLMTANIFGLSSFIGSREGDMPLTRPAGFHYRILVHRGWVHEAQVHLRYLNWLYPPEVVTIS